ncbi:hypothetical protein [Niveibacterium microcysteis]|uniref:Uncharacterized protein n=1 Tax=Niveibacterium microcysteis TaxID=2811415 RepID=A0ABX7MAL3_9RHOO|nr:hypothetical protein [Niveibacterium microcysteis]QSI78785.1 hypothetical protein JY500_09340 [Niveibacterium microcysteis]
MKRKNGDVVQERDDWSPKYAIVRIFGNYATSNERDRKLWMGEVQDVLKRGGLASDLDGEWSQNIRLALPKLVMHLHDGPSLMMRRHPVVWAKIATELAWDLISPRFKSKLFDWLCRRGDRCYIGKCGPDGVEAIRSAIEFMVQPMNFDHLIDGQYRWVGAPERGRLRSATAVVGRDRLERLRVALSTLCESDRNARDKFLIRQPSASERPFYCAIRQSDLLMALRDVMPGIDRNLVPGGRKKVKDETLFRALREVVEFSRGRPVK